MKQKNKKIELLGSAPISHSLLLLGLPIMIGMLINAFYNIVDAYFVGKLGESAMAAISIVFPIGQVVVGLGLMFGNGAASYLSRLLGKDDKKTANQVASVAIYSSIFIGLVFITITLVFMKYILKYLGATSTIMPYALPYARIYILSCIFNIFNVTMNNIVASEGASRTTMSALLLGALANIFLDPIFIYYFDLGVIGAAIATAISQFISTLVYIIYILKKESYFSFNIRNFHPTKEIFFEIFKIGVPTLTFQFLTSLSIALINISAANYGDTIIATMGVVTRIISMGTLVVFGFLKGFQPIAGFSYGAKNFDRLNKSIKISILWSTTFCIVAGLITIIFSKQIVSQFANGNNLMISLGQKSLIANALSFYLDFIQFTHLYFLPLGKVVKDLYLELVDKDFALFQLF